MNFNPWKRNLKKLDKVWILRLMSDPKGIGFETEYSTSQNVGPSTCHKKKVLLFELSHKVKPD